MTYKKICEQIDAAHASGDMEGLFSAIHRLAMKIIFDEDGAQDAAMRVWERRDKYRPTGSTFSRWANKIISDKRSDYQRELAGRFTVMQFSNVTRDQKSGEIEVHFQDDECVRDPHIEFPDKRSEFAFNLKDAGYSDAEIARELGMTPGALRVQMNRWRKQIFVRPANKSRMKPGYRYRGEERDSQESENPPRAA